MRIVSPIARVLGYVVADLIASFAIIDQSNREPSLHAFFGVAFLLPVAFFVALKLLPDDEEEKPTKTEACHHPAPVFAVCSVRKSEDYELLRPVDEAAGDRPQPIMMPLVIQTAAAAVKQSARPVVPTSLPAAKCQDAYGRPIYLN